MPYTQDSLPWQGSAPLAAHCSFLGAQDAAERAQTQSAALLAAYRTHGPLTDAEAAHLLRLDRSSVNARRSQLIAEGQVQAAGSRINRDTGIRNTTWGLVGPPQETHSLMRAATRVEREDFHR